MSWLDEGSTYEVAIESRFGSLAPEVLSTNLISSLSLRRTTAAVLAMLANALAGITVGHQTSTSLYPEIQSRG